MQKFAGTGWANTEYRSYSFGSHESDKGHLVETQASRDRRDVKPLDKEERTNLKRTSTRGTDDGSGSHSQTVQIQAKV